MRERMRAYIGTGVVAGVYGCVKELSKMADSETAIAGSGRRGAALDVIEDGLGVGFGDKRCSMVIVPSPLLLDTPVSASE